MKYRKLVKKPSLVVSPTTLAQRTRQFTPAMFIFKFMFKTKLLIAKPRPPNSVTLVFGAQKGQKQWSAPSSPRKLSRGSDANRHFWSNTPPTLCRAANYPAVLWFSFNSMLSFFCNLQSCKNKFTVKLILFLSFRKLYSTHFCGH